MTSNPDHIPENALIPMEEQRQRARELAEIRRNQATPQHVAFVNHYFAFKFDHATAAEAVGITNSKALEWIETEDHPVCRMIQARLIRMGEVSDITTEEIVALLIKEATREPSGPGDKTVSHLARVNALERLGRIKGSFDKGSRSGKKVTVNISVEAPKPGEEVSVSFDPGMEDIDPET